MIRNCGMKALLTCAAQAARLADGLADTALECVILVDAEQVPPDLAGRLPVPVVAGEVMLPRAGTVAAARDCVGTRSGVHPLYVGQYGRIRKA